MSSMGRRHNTGRTNLKDTLRRVSMIGIACSMLVACGGDSTEPSANQVSAPGTAATTADSSDDDQSPTESSDVANSTTPPASVDEQADQAAAQDALLQLSDFGPGWSEVPSSDDGDQDEMKRNVAECSGSDLDTGVDFGGAIAKTGDVTSPDGEQVVQATVSFAPSIAVASERFATIAAPEFPLCIQPIYEQFVGDLIDGTGAELDGVTIGKLNVTPVGDSTVAYRITVTASDSGLTQELYADIIVIQAGRILASLTFQSRNSPFSIADAEMYVALAAGRLPAT